MLLPLLLSLLLSQCRAITVNVTDYSLKFFGKDCMIGQNLTIGSKDRTYTLCNTPSQDQLDFICQTVQDCKADTGLVTSGGDTTDNFIINSSYTEFKEGCHQPVKIVCYNLQSQCLLPREIANGTISLDSKPLDLSSQRVVNLEDVVTLTCQSGYMSYYNQDVPCKQVLYIL